MASKLIFNIQYIVQIRGRLKGFSWLSVYTNNGVENDTSVTKRYKNGRKPRVKLTTGTTMISFKTQFHVERVFNFSEVKIVQRMSVVIVLTTDVLLNSFLRNFSLSCKRPSYTVLNRKWDYVPQLQVKLLVKKSCHYKPTSCSGG